ncbi:MAG: tRNA lysidine(34) synthetase TilS [Clostridia bacterium]|nr:tRNA lysidine(34) synthetase TilS [Clostridia bacterium]
MIKLKNVEKNKVIAVALSGGKDSMCLLDLLLKSSKKLNITVKAVNIDHSIRGEESERDSNFVKDYCSKFNVPLKFFKVDAIKYSKENNLTVEEGARILRYNIFSSLLNENYADLIATAHHLSDNFETVLFNIFRGTSTKGLTGIPDKRDGFIRPLIDVTRGEIDKYISKNNIPFVEDSTNGDIDYTRNYLRNVVIPKILEKFPTAETSVKRLGEISREENDFLDDLANKNLDFNDGKYYLPVDLSPILLKRATKTILYNLGIKKDYESVHFKDVLKLTTLKSGSKINLPKNVVAVKEYNKLAFYIEGEKREVKSVKFKVGKFNFLDNTRIISATPLDNALVFDGDKIPENAVIRTKRDGDVFKKFGGGTKKLKDYLIDKKIPRADRDNLPLVAVDNKILIIFGVEISDDIKITESTTNTLYAK